LPGDTYEEWLGTQTEHPAKARSHETNMPTSYDIWIGKRVQTEIERSRTRVKRVSKAPKSKARR
jgi:hypothetical protein